MGAPGLRLVDIATGEVHDGCPNCAPLEAQVEALQTENGQLVATVKGQALQIGNLKAEVRELHGSDPNSDDVRGVLGHWAQRVVDDGWWQVRPRYKPGDQRWSVTRARLRDGYPVSDLVAAIEGQLLPPTKREWLDVTTIFRNGSNLERAREKAYDPQNLKRLQWRALPDELREVGKFELNRCDCGHLRLFHSPVNMGPEVGVLEVCRDCDCGGFTNWDETMREYEQRQAEQHAREKARAARQDSKSFGGGQGLARLRERAEGR